MASAAGSPPLIPANAGLVTPSTPHLPPSPTDTVIAFFDVETTIPSRVGQGYALLEFGAILVCPRRLLELDSFSTLVCPRDPSAISLSSVRCNGITRDAVASAPPFADIADRVYHILHGKLWAGHNILRFDCARIREAFAEIGRAPPEPRGAIDTLPLLTQTFGRRAGDMKMATLANYFGLGQQKHRSLDDVRMNLEVLKYCATVLFLESNYMEYPTMNSLVSLNATTRSSFVGNVFVERMNPGMRSASYISSSNRERTSLIDSRARLGVQDTAEFSELVANTGASDLTPLIEQMKLDILPIDDSMDIRPASDSPQILLSSAATSDNSSFHAGFIEPEVVAVSSLSAPLLPSHRGGCRILIMHRNDPLQLYFMGLRVHFGVSTKFLDHAGRPKLSIVVNAPASLCKVLDACDHLARRSSLESGSNSEWRPVIRKDSASNSSTIRLQIPTVANGNVASYSTEIYQREPSGGAQKLLFSKFDVMDLESLFAPGTIVDAYFSVDLYDYQQYAGIRLVAQKLVAHPN